MEIFDVVDVYGRPTGETIERGEAHRLGVRHRTAHIWVIRKDCDGYQVLLQKRCETKESFPGQYDTSAAGHITAGDKPAESALRELKEELGIEADLRDLEFVGTFTNEYTMTFHGKPFHDNEISFVYAYMNTVDEKTLTLQEDEVSEVKWFDIEDLRLRLEPRDPAICVPRGGFELIYDFVNKRD